MNRYIRTTIIVDLFIDTEEDINELKEYTKESFKHMYSKEDKLIFIDLQEINYE